MDWMLSLMLVSNTFTLEVLQVSGFTRDHEFSPKRVLREVQRAWGDLYDGDVISLPGTEVFPVDAPLLILSSADGRHRLEIARARANLFRVRVDEEPLDQQETLQSLAEQLARVAEVEEIPIGRLASVATRFADIDEPAKEVARHFFQQRWLVAPFNRLQQLEVHSHKVFNLMPELRVNSWVRVKIAQRLETLAPIIVVEQDINTLPEERAERDFNRADISGFYDRVGREFTHIMHLYFPPTASPEET